jgi:tRNA (mo5U34)-methyltransferase
MSYKPTMEEINKIKWWHRIALPVEGEEYPIETPGCTDSMPKFVMVDLPRYMTGMRVLDIGAWDGWWSFLCERMGAAEVVAMDTWGFDTGRAGFDLAKKALDSKVIPVRLDVHDLSLEWLYGVFGGKKFDLILCLGALHHFEDPLRALKAIRSVCKGKLILETHMDMIDISTACCAVYGDGDMPYNDPTILWGPNESCLRTWLHKAGFSNIAQVGYSSKIWSGGGVRGAFHADAVDNA